MSQIDRVLRSNLRLRHLQLLVALDRFRQLGRAADFLALTQPAVSKMLAEVERLYGVALFTPRGNSTSVIAAFAAGFLTVLAFQPFIIDSLSLPLALKGVAFPWQLVLGSAIAALVCAAGRPVRTA